MILVTGGAGYIGSHTVCSLVERGHQVLVYDNYSNSSPESVKRVTSLHGTEIIQIEGDITNEDQLNNLFSIYEIEAVVHFAGLKAVGESRLQPLKYYENNVTGTLTLCKVMAQHGVKKLIFSSSATVYGESEVMPLCETMPLGNPSNAYGWSKLMVEQILQDLAASDPAWSIGILRYFNPVGAHASGLIGEDPLGIPNNLVPYISQVAIGRLPELSIFGGDYPTIDGSGVRDYIHVMDLAEGHISALDKLTTMTGVGIWNLGTGQGYSVLQLVKAFEEVSGMPIPHKITTRRPGDLAQCWASTDKAYTELGWQATRSLHEMMADTWRWQKNNPLGYAS